MTTTALAPTLADVRDASLARRRAEVDEIVTVVAWLEQHLVDARWSDDVAVAGFGDGELLLAGEGAPAVSEAAVVELVTTLEKSDSAGRVFVGKCLELKYRLPQLWQYRTPDHPAPHPATRRVTGALSAGAVRSATHGPEGANRPTLPTPGMASVRAIRLRGGLDEPG